jgi:hypothetical protein
MKSQDFKVIVNDTYEFDNLDLTSLDMIQAEGKGHFHILQGSKSYRAELIDSNFDQKKMQHQGQWEFVLTGVQGSPGCPCQ